MATPSKDIDRRAERTHALIRGAFIDLAREKSLSAISIQDITDRANISRGTFYAHFADKYALIDLIMREDFQRTVSTLSLESGWNKTTLQTLIQIILDYFKTVYQRHHREHDIAPLIEQIVHEELYTLILSWLKDSNRPNTPAPMSPEMLAQIISWAIFGAALQWNQESAPLPAAQTAAQIVQVIMDGTANQLDD
ncbi:MAG: TetR family transcriptional regulator [Chloroflexota bacterium]